MAPLSFSDLRLFMALSFSHHVAIRPTFLHVVTSSYTLLGQVELRNVSLVVIIYTGAGWTVCNNIIIYMA